MTRSSSSARGRAVRQVGGQHRGPAALRGDLGGQLLELVGGAGDERDVVAATDELAGDLGADALGGAGDDAGAVGAGKRKAHARSVGLIESAPGTRSDDRVAGGDERLVGLGLLEPQLEPPRQERPAAPERHRRDVGDHLVEQSGVGELTGEVSPADDPDVLAAGGRDQLGVHRRTSPARTGRPLRR